MPVPAFTQHTALSASKEAERLLWVYLHLDLFYSVRVD